MFVDNMNKVIACFKAVDFNFDFHKFEHRLIAQKVIFLLHLKGIGMGYQFGLYVRGPYSQTLASDYYAHSDQSKDLNTYSLLPSEEISIIKELDTIFSRKASLLEIGATYGYFAYHMRYDSTQALRLVKKMKSQYSDTQIAIGISKAKEFLFKVTEEDQNHLNGEIAPWRAVALQSFRGD